MDKQSETFVGLIDESFKGNLRLRLHRTRRNDGSFTYLVELAAWNSWAGQAKLLQAWGGIELVQGQQIIAFFKEHVRAYDWHTDEILPEV